MTKRERIALIAVLVAILLRPDIASAQCAMCRSLLATPEGQQIAAAFRSGILLLLAAPFAVFGTVVTLAVRANRRRVRRWPVSDRGAGEAGEMHRGI